MLTGKIKKLEKIMQENRCDMFTLCILYNMSCHENYAKLDYLEKKRLLKILYIVYLKDETKTDLGAFSDCVMANYKEILGRKIVKYSDIYNLL